MPAFNFAGVVLKWHKQHGRHDLPWQQPRTPYRVWISEIMLQQTQASTVVSYFETFMAKFPTLETLAQASQEQVMQQWAGLGYYSRARNLHKTAQLCVSQHASRLPNNFAALLLLPGIGRSTAGAILSQAHGLPFAILDGNVKRVLARFHAIDGLLNSTSTTKQLWLFAEAHLPKNNLANYTQAMMDLGATVCTNRKPQCSACPLMQNCLAFQTNRVEQLPNKAASKTIPRREIYALVIINTDNEILLEKRPNSGIWGGLYSLPESGDISQAKSLATRFIDQPKSEYLLEPFTHQFSHFKLNIRPIAWQNCAKKLQIRDNDQFRWVARQQLAQLGLPTPIKKLLQDLP